MRRRLGLLLLAVMLCVCLPAAAQEGGGTAEAAIDAFVRVVAAGDYVAAMDLMCATRQVEAFSWEATVERLQAYMPGVMSMPAPDLYKAYQPINEAIVRGQMARLLYDFLRSFITQESLDGTSFAEVDAQWMAQYVEALNPDRLQGLSVVLVLDPMEGLDSDMARRMADTFAAQAASCGAAEKVERVVLYALDDRYFSGGFSLLRYGEGWYVERLNSILASQDARGTVTEVPADAVEAYLETVQAGR